MLRTDSPVPGILLGGALSAVFYVWYRPKATIPLPPGPKGHFMRGSLLEVMNADIPWLTFAEYANQYGPLVTVRVLHQKMFLLSDPHLAHELFEKRAANYSDRTLSPMIELQVYANLPFFKTFRSLPTDMS
ncbi:hypothetical protein FRC12_010389 [Ceratobasidium sp. 428]|nr:hypothetical protein FRC12_010389 [Ceratobasidium sp. 428]